MADHGSATPLAAAMVAVLVMITAGATYLGVAVAARHRAQAAADLGALAAAHGLASGADAACTWARAVLAAMSAEMVSCETADLDTVVVADIPVHLGRFGMGTARAMARAGPGDPAV
ncbi:Rv3654c family TadE-like protein [Mycolicibacterium sp. GF69]|uniref:Rv3654c family TadE-like protein n=1 Tax=Mycolicibacterium sp. GF69 TaxID=2267251 RepID=UPI00210FB0EE|nr:Rv3654c family TadE-like protein [Mycolicibacterium sp. GF69]